MSKKKEKVRMRVARDGVYNKNYVLSFSELRNIADEPDNKDWWGTDGQELEALEVCAKEFHKAFKYRLRPGAKPRLIEFDKIEVREVKE